MSLPSLPSLPSTPTLRSLPSLDSPDGHIAICLVLMILGAVFYKLQIPKGEDIIIGAFGGLLACLRANSYVPQSRELLPPSSYLKDESR